MLLVRGHGGGTTLTGTVYEPGEEPPRFKGAPDGEAPFVWVCDEFYEVESGGSVAEIGGRTLRVAFDAPMPRGFDDREAVLAAAREHVRTQFARVGVGGEGVRIEVEQVDPDAETGTASM
jgi:hypothetical protein